MAHERTSSGPAGDPAFRTPGRTPEDFERYAALFVPTWDLSADSSDPTTEPGFASALRSAANGEGLIDPSARVSDAESRLKATMMGIAPSRAWSPAEPTNKPALRATSSAIAVDSLPRMRKSPLVFVLLGGAIAVAAASWFLLRGTEPTAPKPTEREHVIVPKGVTAPEAVLPPEGVTAPQPAVAAPTRGATSEEVKPSEPPKVTGGKQQPSEPAGAKPVEKPTAKPEKPVVKPAEKVAKPAAPIPNTSPAPALPAPKAVAPPPTPKAPPPPPPPAKKAAPKMKDDF